MLIEIALLAVALLLILAAAVFFTNGVEHLGERLNLGEAAVGSVLAAVGTAMPETLIPVVAILLSKGAASDAIGLGAILGAPFMLSTLALTVTGVAAFVYAKRRDNGSTLLVRRGALVRDLAYFLSLFTLAVATAWLPAGPVRWGVCVILLGGYVKYVIANLRENSASVEGREPLRLQSFWVRLSLTRLPEETREAFLHRRRKCLEGCPHPVAITAQVILALAIMLVGARMFVYHVEQIAASLGVSGLVIALLLAPVATELPEKLNSVIWVRQGKEVLSLGNITGAMVFQSSIPATLGIALTDWKLNDPAHGHAALISAGIALTAATAVLLCARHRHHLDTATDRTSLSPWVLLIGLPLYLLFIISVIFHW